MKLLVIRFSALGDVILTTGAINFIKNKGIFDKIDVLTFEHFKDVFMDNPNINEVLTVKKDITLWDYLDFVQKNISDYDYILDLQGKLKTFILRIFSDASILGYKKLTIRRRIYTKFRLFEDHLNEHTSLRYVHQIVSKFRLASPNMEDVRPKIFLKDRDKDRKKIVIHPFASKNTKIWSYFDKLVSLLQEDGFEITIIGEGNFPLLKSVRDLRGKTTLIEMFEEIKSANLLLTTDSGPMHAGIALNTKTVAIFGSTTKQYGFYPYFSDCYVIENNDLSCRPCHVHGLSKCPEGHFKCMKDISVDEVYRFVKRVI